jgi:hypothetical protein
MRTYWLEVILITAIFVGALAVPLVHADPDNGTTVVTDGGTTVAASDSATVLQDGNLTIAGGPDGSAIVVQPLQAPGNPYANAYTDFDNWVYSNMSQGGFSSGLQNNPNQPGLRTVRVAVDRDGYVIPQFDTRILAEDVDLLPWEAQQQIREDANNEMLYGRTAEDVDPDPEITGVEVKGAVPQTPVQVTVDGDPDPDIRYVYVSGEMDEATARAIEAQRAEAYARAFPPVPSWLRDIPAENVLFLPNGEVAIQPADNNSTWVRYDAAGKVVATSKPGQSWQILFADNYDTLAADAQARNLDIVTSDGYIVLRDKASRKVVATYDFDGTPVQIDAMASPRPFYFKPLRWTNVLPVADAQLRVPMAGREIEAGGGVQQSVKP